MAKIASMTVLVPKELHTKFKMVSVKKGVSMTALLIEAIKQIVKKEENRK